MGRKPVLDWIDTNEAAEMIGKSPQWVRDLIHRHKFTNVTKAGRVYLIRKKDVEEYLRQTKLKNKK